MEGVAAGKDSILWAYLSRDDGKASTRSTSYLARLDGSGWTVFDEFDGAPPHAARYAREGQARVLMAVAPDGGAWLTPLQGDRCRGLMHFDGSRTRSYFESGACVADLAVGDDGTARISISARRAGLDQVWDSGLYAVAP